MRLSSPIRSVLLVLLVLMLTPGCAVFKMIEHGSLALDPPELEYRNYDYRNIGIDKIGVDIIFAAHNPNNFELERFFVDYQFYMLDTLVAEGYALEVNLDPGLNKLAVPVDMRYQNLMAAAGSVADRIIKGDKEIPSKVHVSIYGEYFGFDWFGQRVSKMYNYKHDVKMDIPVPKVTMDDVERTAKTAVNAFLNFKLFDDSGRKKAGEPEKLAQSPVRVTSENIDMSALESDYSLDWGVDY